MHFDPGLIGRSAEEGARRVALALLAACDAEAARLARREEDPEALHDFRVALRRLRTALRAFRPLLAGRVRRKTERRLRKVARATSGARDAEVQLAWLAAQEPALTGRGRLGLELLRERIAARGRASAPGRRLQERYARASRAAARQLRARRSAGEQASPRGRFGAGLARLLVEQLGAARAALERAVAAKDPETLHRARIEAKRLRYAAEPLRGHPAADSRAALARLQALQDVLGELNDGHVLAGEIGAAMAELAADRARRLHAAVYAGARGPALREALRGGPARGALLPVLALVRARREALLAELERSWRAGAVEALAADVLAVAGALEAGAGSGGARARRSAPAGRRARGATRDR